jgi:hypothetical protein
MTAEPMCPDAPVTKIRMEMLLALVVGSATAADI